ncbi:tyrosine-type recombinase/integrase [Actinoplanes sp. NBC_00393]|uniref:tyrosine-type recombinase/integrase n=1 Tax=Actinoplanes sp. NBC_00393 TaxID=2975953 RepID=UPI002E1EEA8B
MALAVVRDLHALKGPPSESQVADLETDVVAGFVLARAAAGITDRTIEGNLTDLEQIRAWFGAPIWAMQPKDADRFFGTVLRHAAATTRYGKASTLSLFFAYLELRHRAEIYALTGVVPQCPIDEMNRPRNPQCLIRIPPSEQEMQTLLTGWREDLASCRKYATAARNFAVCRLMTQVGSRVKETLQLDVCDVRWDLGRFGKVLLRFGKGSRGRGPKQRLVPLINGARGTLEWFVEDVWGQFGDDWDRLGAPLFPSERKSSDGGCFRLTAEQVRVALAEAVVRHLPAWQGRLTPHVLRHYCASQLYLSGMDLWAIQELLGHTWALTTMRYVHVARTHIEESWLRGQERAARRLEGAR